MGQFQKPIGQGRFAVVDMGYDAKISDVFHWAAKIGKISFAASEKRLKSAGGLGKKQIIKRPNRTNPQNHQTNPQRGLTQKSKLQYR